MSIELHGVILHVDDLARAVNFYTHVLDFRVAEQAADSVLLASPSGTSTIAVRERPTGHFTDRIVQTLVWRVPTVEALDEVEQRLERLQTATIKRTVPADGLTLLSAKDPEGERLLFVHTERAGQLPTKIPSEVYWY